MKPEPKRFWGTILIAVSLTAFFVGGSLWLINQPFVSQYVLRTASAKNPWKMTVKSLRIEPFQRRIVVEGFSAMYPQRNGVIQVDHLSAELSPLGLLRGKLVFHHVDVAGVRIVAPKGGPATKKPTSINLSKLLLLQNIVIESSSLRDISLIFGANQQHDWRSDELQISFRHHLLGATNLSLQGSGTAIESSGRIAFAAAALSVDTTTKLTQWSSRFPYVNAWSGKLHARDVSYEEAPIENISALLTYNDGALHLSPLAMTVAGNTLEGELALHTQDEDYALAIRIPEAIQLPHIGRSLLAYDTGGTLAGNIELKGKGFMPRHSQGNGVIELEHRFNAAPDRRVQVSVRARWSNGRVVLESSQVGLEDTTARLNGFIDIPQKHFSFSASGERFPLEAVFQNFRYEPVTKIRGDTDFSGTIEGWGKNFTAKVHGITRDGGWGPLHAEYIESDFMAGYDDIDLVSRIHQGEQQVGNAHLHMRFGPNLGAEIPRSKNIDLSATVENIALSPIFGTEGEIAGAATGHIELHGPSVTATGEATLALSKGMAWGLPVEIAQSRIHFRGPKIVLEQLTAALGKSPPVELQRPLTLDVQEQGSRLSGEPFPGWHLDLTHDSLSKRWRITDLSYTNPVRSGERFLITGTIQEGGALDIKTTGQLDLGLFTPLANIIRDASGVVNIDVRASGVASDPNFNGQIRFSENILSPRAIYLPLENLSGTIQLEGKKIVFTDIRAHHLDGEFSMQGSATHRAWTLSNIDLALSGKNLLYRSPEQSLRIECAGNITIKGNFPSPLLSGSIDILDAKYTKDFTLLDTIAGRTQEAKRTQPLSKDALNPKLNVRIRNTGDAYIRNNIGIIGLNFEIDVTGTREKPKVLGTVATTSGAVNYLGVAFDITKGFIEFREAYANPYMEVTGQKEIGVYNVTLLLHGFTDNLALDLSATSPSGSLEKRDVVSLLVFGMTESERRELAAAQGNQLGAQLAASQVSALLERPIAQATHLDVFRLEAADPNSQAISRVYIGKQLNDRLSMDFSTDVNTDQARQTVGTEYLLTDNLLLRATNSVNQRFGAQGTLRFQLR